MNLFTNIKHHKLTDLVSLLAIALNSLADTSVVIRRRRRTYLVGFDGV